MYGLRRPHRSLQVLSLNAPIRGWMNRPVMGPAMFRIGRSCSLAPMYKNNGLTAENTMPNPNELPKNPSVITRMFIWVSGGFRSPATASSTADGGLTLPDVVVVAMALLKGFVVAARDWKRFQRSSVPRHIEPVKRRFASGPAKVWFRKRFRN